MPLHISAEGACITNHGPVKTVNEDACLVDRVVSMISLQQAESFALFPLRTLAVADGIGGHKAGEQASSLVVGTIAKCQDFSVSTLYNLLCQTNHALFEMASQEEALQWMGATVAGLAVTDQGLVAFNVGDARVYQVQSGALTQVTLDDSLEELLKQVDPSELPPDLPRGGHVLTQSLGGTAEMRELEPHFYSIAEPAGRFLLCTDGLSSVVPHATIDQIMRENPDPADCVNALFVESMATGGTDDVTIVVMDLKLH